MLRRKTFKRETTHNGTLKTPVTFRRMVVSDDFYEDNVVEQEAYKCFAEVFGVSNQDLEDFKGRFTKNALTLESIKSKAVKRFLTLKIRDPKGTFQPSNQDTVLVHDTRYQDLVWDVVNVEPDFYNRKILVVHLAG